MTGADLLTLEHQVVWSYGTAGAHLPVTERDQALTAFEAHERQRDALVALLQAGALPAPPPLPAYSLPRTVTDRGSALQVLAVIEDACVTAYAGALEGTYSPADPALRLLAARHLATVAALAARWRLVLGLPPAAAVQAVPGAP